MIKEYSIEDEHTGRDVEVLTSTIDELEKVKKEYNETVTKIHGLEKENAELLEKIDELTTKCRRLEEQLDLALFALDKYSGHDYWYEGSFNTCEDEDDYPSFTDYELAEEALKEINLVDYVSEKEESNGN